MPRTAVLLVLALVCLLPRWPESAWLESAWPKSAWAEQPAATPAAPATTATAPAATGQVARPGAADDALRALEILRDDKRRAELIATLEAIAAAGQGDRGTPGRETTAPAAPGQGQSAETPAAKTADSTIRLAPDSLGARMLLGVSETMRDAMRQAQTTFFAVGDLPWLARWVYSTVTEPLMRGWILGVLWRLALVVAIGLALGALTWRALRRPRAALDATIAAASDTARQAAEAESLERAEYGAVEAEGEEATQSEEPGRLSLARRIAFALGLFGLNMAPILGFVIGTHAALASPLGGTQLSQLVITSLVQAVTLWRASLALVGAMAAPGRGAARLLPIADDTVGWLLRWTGRIAAITFFATALLQSALLLGLPRPAHAGWLKIASLAWVTCLVMMVAQRRHAVAEWLRGDGRSPFGDMRRMLAPVWHWLAIAYLLAMWVVWAADYGVGEVHVLTAMISTLVVLVAMRLLSAGIVRTLERRLAVPADLAERYPGLELRAHSYRQLIHWLVGACVLVAGLLVLGEIWGLSPVQRLLSTRTGRDMLASMGTIGTTLALALGVWEAVTLGMGRHMARLTAQGEAARSARLRTLQPMLRTALLVAIIIVVGLTVLSQIGVNIAPLLAGAGVLGLAIGIGSQRLVQDLITGLFLLLENAMQVGDVVTVAGVSGVVEDLSIRSIRLRTEDGSMQIIPFSAVTSVTNMTRDFSQAVIEVQVSYHDDYDRVIAVMQDIAADLRADPLWQTDIINDLEVMGLIAFDVSGITIKCRLRCLPFSRWRVQREFHRRLKLRFEQEGIEIPYPHRKIIVEGRSDVATAPGTVK